MRVRFPTDKMVIRTTFVHLCVVYETLNNQKTKNMKTKNVLTTAIIALFFLAGCKRETTTTTVPNTLQSFFAGTRVASQTFAINATNYNQIVGAKNTKITIPGGCLIDKYGHTVTGNANIELKEIYSKGDMILSNATTTTATGMLESGGEIYLKVRQNGEDLRVKPGYSISVSFPTTNPVGGMQLFTGAFVANTNLAADSALVWTPVDSTAANIVQDSFSSYTFYDFPVDSFGWTNCDRFYDNPGGTDPMIQVPSTFDNTNTSVYMIFDAENAVANGDVYDDATHIFRFHAGTHTPTGLSVTIVVIAKIGTQYYYSINHEVTAAGATFNVTPLAATHDAIVTAVSAL